MGNELLITIVYALISVAVGFAWVGGYLDKYQSKAQEILLDKMGENKMSYGLKSSLNQKVVEQKEINDAQGEISQAAGGLVGKGGIGEGVGAGLSKGL
ncbi:hypothetical protein MMC20_007019 [Loxospora ochrophaea]|nr:hypothetical protein [Loxospora ochrophaea]